MKKETKINVDKKQKNTGDVKKKKKEEKSNCEECKGKTLAQLIAEEDEKEDLRKYAFKFNNNKLGKYILNSICNTIEKIEKSRVGLIRVDYEKEEIEMQVEINREYFDILYSTIKKLEKENEKIKLMDFMGLAERLVSDEAHVRIAYNHKKECGEEKIKDVEREEERKRGEYYKKIFKMIAEDKKCEKTFNAILDFLGETKNTTGLSLLSFFIIENVKVNHKQKEIEIKYKGGREEEYADVIYTAIKCAVGKANVVEIGMDFNDKPQMNVKIKYDMTEEEKKERKEVCEKCENEEKCEKCNKNKENNKEGGEVSEKCENEEKVMEKCERCEKEEKGEEGIKQYQPFPSQFYPIPYPFPCPYTPNPENPGYRRTIWCGNSGYR